MKKVQSEKVKKLSNNLKTKTIDPAINQKNPIARAETIPNTKDNRNNPVDDELQKLVYGEPKDKKVGDRRFNESAALTDGTIG